MDPGKPDFGPVVGRRLVASRAAAIAAVAAGSIGFLTLAGSAPAEQPDARSGRRHGNNACVQHCRAHGADNCRQTCRRHVQPR